MPAGVPANEFPIAESDIAETFADSLGVTMFDGNTLRIEFCTVRLDPAEAGTPNRKPKGKRHVNVRLVLDSEGAVALVNQCMQYVSVMEQRGQIKRRPPAAASTAVAEAMAKKS